MNLTIIAVHTCPRCGHQTDIQSNVPWYTQFTDMDDHRCECGLDWNSYNARLELTERINIRFNLEEDTTDIRVMQQWYYDQLQEEKQQANREVAEAARRLMELQAEKQRIAMGLPLPNSPTQHPFQGSKPSANDILDRLQQQMFANQVSLLQLAKRPGKSVSIPIGVEPRDRYQTITVPGLIWDIDETKAKLLITFS